MFIQPVSMNVTAEQYQEDLRKRLLEMGYKEVTLSVFDTHPTLVTNYTKNNQLFSNLSEERAKDNNRYFIDHYNPELFLAIAAMTEYTTGGIGQWWMCTEETISFKKGKLYKQIRQSIFDSFCLIDEKKDRNGLGENLRYFRKATLGEIVNHFTKQKTMTKSIDERFPFVLNEENYKRIIKIACGQWRNKLVTQWGVNIVINESVVVTEEFYKEMRKACDREQNQVFDEIFGKDKPEWSLKDAKDGEPVWVRDYSDALWELRYANGKGSAYNDQSKSGLVTHWTYARKFDPSDLPVKS